MQILYIVDLFVAGLPGTFTPETMTTPAPMEKCMLPLDPSEGQMDPADEGAFQFGITSNSHYEYPTLPDDFRRG